MLEDCAEIEDCIGDYNESFLRIVLMITQRERRIKITHFFIGIETCK